MSNSPLAPTTTVQEDLVAKGQRRINVVWEVTQSLIAIFITVAIIYSSVTSTGSSELSNAFFLIIGFYFSRTNHSNIGGVGEKPQSDYQGR